MFAKEDPRQTDPAAAALDPVSETGEALPLMAHATDIDGFARRLSKASGRIRREAATIERIEDASVRAGAGKALALFTATDLQWVAAHLQALAAQLKRHGLTIIAGLAAAKVAAIQSGLACIAIGAHDAWHCPLHWIV